MLLEIHPYNPQSRYINQVIDVLQNDGVIIYPTDTVYGLGCNIYSKKALKKISLINKKEKNISFEDLLKLAMNYLDNDSRNLVI